MLGQLAGADRALIADMEAGVGNLTRMAEASIDALIVVAEPSPKSIEVAQRAASIAAERKIGPVRFVANKVRGEDDASYLRDSLGDDIVVVPDDAGIRLADRDGRSPLDVSPSGPAVRSLEAFATELRTMSDTGGV